MRALLVALVLLPLWAQAARTYVIAIGNDVGRPDEVTLRYARTDAERFARVLRRLGGVRATDLVSLGNADAAQAQLAFEAVATRIAAESTRQNTAVVVYYSGHADALGLHLGDSTLTYAALRATVQAIPAAVRVLVIDGCRSGGLTRVKGAAPAESFALDLDDQLAVQGTAVMTSSAAGEDSHESDRLGGSFFTHHLVSALLGAGDHDADGKVTLTEAYTYAYHHTLQASGRTSALQHPTYRYDLKGRGDFVMTRPGDAPGNGTLKMVAPVRHLVRADRADGPLRAEVVPDRAGGQVSLAPGTYFVQARHRDHYREYTVRLSRDETVDLGGVPSHRVTYARLVRKGGARRAAHGLMLLVGSRAPILDTRPWAPEPVLGYGLDLPWATLGLRGRFSQTETTVDGLPITERTFGAGLTIERVFDLSRWLSLGVGLQAEGFRLAQALPEADRATWGVAFGGLLSLEVPIAGPVSARLEGGPVTHVFKRATVRNGAQTGDGLTSRITGQAALGLGVRF